METMPTTYCGFVAIIGKPNVGKSTLVNQFIGQKISITSRKPQTTRQRILGIQTIENKQIIYFDTPGLHLQQKRMMNRYMNKVASRSIRDADAVLWVIDAKDWNKEEASILEEIKSLNQPVILVMNKVDCIPDKQTLLPLIDRLKHQYPFVAIVPISAKKGKYLDDLQKEINPLIPEGVWLFPEESVSDRNQQFMIAELIREQIFHRTGEELPYSTAVQIEHIEEKKEIVHISALVVVEREGQKKILIGEGGEKLKEIATKARFAIEALLGKKIYLRVFVKVEKNWVDNAAWLQRLGYHE